MRYLILLISALALSGCGKEFLDIKRDKSQVVPTTIADFQALLDDASNTMNNSSSHELAVIGADEYVLSNQIWNELSFRPYEKNGYVWAKEVYENTQVNDWNNAYRRILFSNSALKGINEIQPSTTQQEAWNNVKGSALFFRGCNFYQLAQLFCKVYNKNSSQNDLGIPLRLDPDVTKVTNRASVEQTYIQIIDDLKAAAPLLPDVAITLFRPSKAAVYALLAKVHLNMGDYLNAEYYATESLKIKSTLIDFNTLSQDQNYTFPLYGSGNSEVLFMCNMLNIAVVTTTRFNASPELLELYKDGDLRKKIFYRTEPDSRVLFKGSYAGLLAFFTGLAVDEVYLIRSECHLRNGQIQNSLDDLNYLLKNRYDRNHYNQVTTTDFTLLMNLIIDERRKELALRGVRWEDLRRFNKETQFAKTITRNLNGTIYKLHPQDLRYIWPIPQNAIEISGYEQNLR